jgi:hypothetical protein
MSDYQVRHFTKAEQDTAAAIERRSGEVGRAEPAGPGGQAIGDMSGRRNRDIREDVSVPGDVHN